MKTVIIILTLVLIFLYNGFAQTSQMHMNERFKFVDHQNYIVNPIAEQQLSNIMKGQPLYFSDNVSLKNELFQNTTLPDSIIGQNFDNISKSWINSYKIALSYDNQGRQNLSISYQWIDSTNRWLGVQKVEEIYNSNGKCILFKDFTWDPTDSAWLIDFMGETKWDTNMEWAKGTYVKWDTAYGQWDSTSKSNTNFDANGNTTLYWTQRKDKNTNEWINNWKEEYVYDSLGNNIKLLEYNWNVNAGIWDSAYRYEYHYDSIGNLSWSLGYQMDETGSIAYGYLFEYTYDNNDNVIQQFIVYNITKSSDQWQYRKIEILRDNDGNATQSHEYQLNISDSLWVLQNFSVTDHDANGNLTTTVSYRILGNDTIPGNKSCYYYSALPTSDNSEYSKEDYPYLYPNPANGYFYLHTNCQDCKLTIQLYDITGKLLINQAIVQTFPVSTEKLHKGVYIFRISENSKIYTGKLVVQ